MVASLEIAFGTRPPLAAGSILSLEGLLAADTADRLEVRAVDGKDAPAAGDPMVLRLDGLEWFRGRVERTTRLADAAHGPRLLMTARSEWAARAEELPPAEEYFQVTDAEAAARLADALGLEAAIDPTARVHGRLMRAGDPLAFLRARGMTCGRQVAVAGGRLHFRAALPRMPVRDLPPGAALLALRTTELSQGACGAFTLAGLEPYFPLERVRLGVLGDAEVRRVVRVSLRAGAGGLATEVVWVQEGVDPARAAAESWEAGGEGSLAGGAAGARERSRT